MSTPVSFDEFWADCLPAEDPVCQATVWTYRIVITSLVVLGTIGNCINIFVFSRRKLRQSPCFLLVFLAIFDMLLLWTLHLQYCFKQVFNIEITESSQLFCDIHAWFLQWAGCGNIMTIAIFTVERMLFTVFPHKTKWHLNRNKSIVVMAVIVAFIGVALGALFALSNKDPREAHKTGNSSAIDARDALKANMSGGDNSSTIDALGVLKADMPEVDNSSTTDALEALKANMSGKGNSSVIDALDALKENTSGEGNGTQMNATEIFALDNGTQIDTTETYEVSNDSSIKSNPLPFCYKFEPGVMFGPLSGPAWKILEIIAIPLPFFVIIVGNIAIIVQNYRRKQTGTFLDSQTKLLFLVTGLLMGTLGSHVIFLNIMRGLSGAGIIDVRKPVVKLVHAIMNALVISNISGNCALYAWKGTLFRRECQAIMKEIRSFKCKCKSSF